MIKDSNYFVGTWHEPDHESCLYILLPDGTARYDWDKEQYVGNWKFRSPDKLFFRVLIPLGIPGVDDDINAEIVDMTITHHDADSFEVTQFDSEGTFTYERSK